MNRKLKENIQAAFNAPIPKRKKGFLLSVDFPKANRLDFVLAQIGYIRKRVWIVTLLVIVPTMILLFSNMAGNPSDFIWVVSSLLPFIVLVGVTEIARSVSHNMAELETSCKHSFSDVVLTRLGILGCTNMIWFIFIIVSFRMTDSVPVMRYCTYLFVPFLLTCSLSLFAFNRHKSRESIYICGGISCFVSIINIIFSNNYRIVFADEYVLFWGIAFCILLIWTVGEIVKLIRRTEESQWNLSLTV